MFAQHESIDISPPEDDYSEHEEASFDDDNDDALALAQSNFNKLSFEIITKIFIHLDTISLCSILLTSRLFNLFVKENEIWEKPILDHKITFTSQDNAYLNYRIFTEFANLQCRPLTAENKYYFNLFHSQDKKLNKHYFKELTSILFDDSYSEEDIINFAWLGAYFDQDQGAFKEILSIQSENLKNDLLHHAVSLDKTNTTRLLLELGANPNTKQSLPLICCASIYENLEITTLLVKYGANIEEYHDQNTPLFHVVRRKNFALAEFFCSKGANVNAEQKNSFSILFAAIIAGDENVVDLLLKKGADILKKDDEGNTALHFAAGQGHDKIVSLLLQHEKGQILINEANQDGVTPLMLAAQKGCKKCCTILLKNDAYTNRSTIQGHTAVHFALFGQHAEIIKILAEYGADCTKDAFFYTREEPPLFIAMFFLNKITKKQTPKMVKTLCEIKADLERRNKDNFTPLYWAILLNNLPVAKVLLQYGANVNAFSFGQYFSLRLAITHKNVELSDFLIKNGADVNLRFGRCGSTPLHLAANKESQKLITLLIGAGACPLAKNSLGKTPGENAFSKKIKQRLSFVESLAARYKAAKTNIQLHPEYGRDAQTQLKILYEKIDSELMENPYNNTLFALSYLFHQPNTQLQCMIVLYVFYLTYSQSENDLRIDRPHFVRDMDMRDIYFNGTKSMEDLKLYIGNNQTFFSHLEHYVIQPLMEGLNKPAFNKEMFKKAFLCLSFLERIIFNTNKVNCFDFAEKIFNILEQFPAIKGAHHLKKYIEKILEGYGNNQEKLASIVDVVKETYELIRKGAKSSALFLGSSKLGDKLQTCMRDELGCSMPFYIVVEPKNGRFFSL